MWILNFMPDIFFHIVLSLGVLGIVVGAFLNFIPVLIPYKLPIQIASICLIVVGIWYEGGIAKDKEYRTKIEEYEQKVLIAEALSESYNVQLQAAIDENKKKIATISAVNKKKLKELSEKLNRECKVDTAVVELLNNAAKGISK